MRFIQHSRNMVTMNMDRYAVSILKDDLIVGHIAKELSRIFGHFIARDCEITCKIIQGIS